MEQLSLTCTVCRATLQQDDGHGCCPSCLGLDHLKQALTENACMICCTMSWEQRVSWLSAVEGLLTPDALRKQDNVTYKRKRLETVSTTTNKSHKEDPLARKVEVLTSEFAQIKYLMLNPQPKEAPLPILENPNRELPNFEEDVLSIAASQNQSTEERNEELSEIHSQFSLDEFQNTAHDSGEGIKLDRDVVKQALQIALARMRRIGNSLSHLMLVLYQSLQPMGGGGDP